MDRRRFLLSVLMLPAAFAGEARAQAGDDAVSFVRDLYMREIARHNAKERGDAEFLNAFAPAAQKIWIAARDNKSPPAVALGPITHAFFGPGALPGREVKLVKIAASTRPWVVAVEISIDGRPRKLDIYLVRDGTAWRFEDIDYGQGESFVSHHRRRAGL